jgi:hypothetical protein
MEEFEKQTSNEWYNKKWLVAVLCICCFPVGLYALWKNSYIGKGWKFAITVIIALIVICNLPGKDESGNASKSTTGTSSPEHSNAKREWVELIRFKGSGDKKSQTFTYNGSDARIRYDFKAGAYAGVLTHIAAPIF